MSRLGWLEDSNKLMSWINTHTKKLAMIAIIAVSAVVFAVSLRTTTVSAQTNQQLAQEILSNPNVSYWTNNGVNTRDEFVALAQGDSAYTTCGSSVSTEVNNNILQFIAEAGKNVPLMVNALADKCHSDGSKHYSGQAVDIENNSHSAYLDSVAAKYGGTQNYETSHMHFDFPCSKGDCSGGSAPVPATPVPTVNAAPCNQQTLKTGDNGNCVRVLQDRLVEKHLSVGPNGPDGAFGSDTYLAVKKYQYDNRVSDAGCNFDGGNQPGMFMTCDGVAGEGTWKAINGDGSCCNSAAASPDPATVAAGAAANAAASAAANAVGAAATAAANAQAGAATTAANAQAGAVTTAAKAAADAAVIAAGAAANAATTAANAAANAYKAAADAEAAGYTAAANAQADAAKAAAAAAATAANAAAGAATTAANAAATALATAAQAEAAGYTAAANAQAQAATAAANAAATAATAAAGAATTAANAAAAAVTELAKALAGAVDAAAGALTTAANAIAGAQTPYCQVANLCRNQPSVSPSTPAPTTPNPPVTQPVPEPIIINDPNVFSNQDDTGNDQVQNSDIPSADTSSQPVPATSVPTQAPVDDGVAQALADRAAKRAANQTPDYSSADPCAGLGQSCYDRINGSSAPSDAAPVDNPGYAEPNYEASYEHNYEHSYEGGYEHNYEHSYETAYETTYEPTYNSGGDYCDTHSDPAYCNKPSDGKPVDPGADQSLCVCLPAVESQL